MPDLTMIPEFKDLLPKEAHSLTKFVATRMRALHRQHVEFDVADLHDAYEDWKRLNTPCLECLEPTSNGEIFCSPKCSSVYYLQDDDLQDQD